MTNTVILGGLDITLLQELDHIILLGCGTSKHAAMFGEHVFKDLCSFVTVRTFDGAVFSSRDLPSTGRVGMIFISQSGETKDLRRCLKHGDNDRVVTIGVVNSVDSQISRSVSCGVYINAGKEVAVASTKSFTSQSIILTMIAIWFAQHQNINLTKRIKYIKSLQHLPHDIKHAIEHTQGTCIKIAEYLNLRNDCFILGKGTCYPVALEGALKMKEIGYIHAEGYEGSCLRHGPYALLVKGTMVILLNPSNKPSDFSIMNSISEELKSRESTIVGISDALLPPLDTYQYVISTKDSQLSAILCNISLQLISYHLAIIKGHDPDFPRNLAKVVSV